MDEVTTLLTPADDRNIAYVIHRPAAYDFPTLSLEQLNDIRFFTPDWIYFGTVQQMSNVARELTRRLVELNSGTKRFYDMNLRNGNYTKELIKELLIESSILKGTQEEILIVEELFGKKYMDLKDSCSWLVDEFGVEGVCVTKGRKGCVGYINGYYLEASGYTVEVADAVGAGDAFAAGFIHGFGLGWEPIEICDFANRLGALIASKRGATPEWSMDEIVSLKLRNR